MSSGFIWKMSVTIFGSSGIFQTKKLSICPLRVTGAAKTLLLYGGCQWPMERVPGSLKIWVGKTKLLLSMYPRVLKM
jgi:hypothetical protein